MLDPKIRQAAELCVRMAFNACREPAAEEDADYVAQWSLVAVVADQLLAEHPADDDEPATLEWCRQVRGLRNTGNTFRCEKWIPAMYYDGHFIELPDGITRGEFRRLCAVLHIVLNGD